MVVKCATSASTTCFSTSAICFACSAICRSRSSPPSISWWRRSRTDPPDASSGFWTNGSGHRGPKAVERLQCQWPNLIPIFTPVHASWLNQIEIYFSVLRRKVLTPGDFADPRRARSRLARLPTPVRNRRAPEWTFTREDLTVLLTRLTLAEQRPAA